MSVSLTVNIAEFQRAAAELVAVQNRRTFPEFVNGQLMALAIAARNNTKKANRFQIEKQMGVVSSRTKLRGGAAGAKGWVRITNRKLGKDPRDTFAGRILIARHAKTGRWGVKGATMEEKAIALIAAKVRSVAFIKSGWMWSINQLKSAVYGRSSLGGEAKGKPKGYAKVARPTVNGVVTGEIGNTALLQGGKHSSWHGKKGNPMPVAQEGLSKAAALVAKDMLDHLAKKLNPDFKKFSAK